MRRAKNALLPSNGKLRKAAPSSICPPQAQYQDQYRDQYQGEASSPIEDTDYSYLACTCTSCTRQPHISEANMMRRNQHMYRAHHAHRMQSPSRMNGSINYLEKEKELGEIYQRHRVYHYLDRDTKYTGSDFVMLGDDKFAINIDDHHRNQSRNEPRPDVTRQKTKSPPSGAKSRGESKNRIGLQNLRRYTCFGNGERRKQRKKQDQYHDSIEPNAIFKETEILVSFSPTDPTVNDSEEDIFRFRRNNTEDSRTKIYSGSKGVRFYAQAFHNAALKKVEERHEAKMKRSKRGPGVLRRLLN